MTENEAIKAIEHDLEWHSKELQPKYKEVLRYAIKALEEIQQYRAIGTVTEFVGLKTYEMNENVKKLVDTVAKTLVEAFENLNIEEVNMYQIGYNKAIDEFLKKICEKYTEEESKGNYKQFCANIKQELAEIAEQMKGE